MHIECLFGLKLKIKLLKGYTPDKILEVKDIRNCVLILKNCTWYIAHGDETITQNKKRVWDRSA